MYISEPETIIEIVFTYHRVKYFKTLINNDEHRLYMDLEDEKMLGIKSVQHKLCTATTRFYNCQVCARQVLVG